MKERKIKTVTAEKIHLYLYILLLLIGLLAYSVSSNFVILKIYSLTETHLVKFIIPIPIIINASMVIMSCVFVWSYLFLRKDAIKSDFNYDDLIIHQIKTLLRYAIVVQALSWTVIALMKCKTITTGSFLVLFATCLIILAVFIFIVNFKGVIDQNSFIKRTLFDFIDD